MAIIGTVSREVRVNPNSLNENIISRQEIREHDWEVSEAQLRAVKSNMWKCDRLLDVAIKFVDRMKQRGIGPVNDEQEGEYIDKIYNLLLDGQAISEIENDDEFKLLIHQQVKQSTIANRLMIYTALKNDEQELELIDKSGRMAVCIDDTKTETTPDGTLYNQRKIRAFKDPLTDRNELLEEGYNYGGEEDLRDIIDNDEIDLKRVNFKCAA